MRGGGRIWVTRTLPGAHATATRLSALGYEPVVRPLLEVRPIPDAFDGAPAPSAIACIALTSPNTVDAIRSGLAAYTHIPAYCVGDTTARAASDAGFSEVHSAAGDIQALAKLISSRMSSGLVFAPGAEQPAGDLPALLPNHEVVRLPVYSTVESEGTIPDALSAVMIHSPRAGATLAKRLSEKAAPMSVIAISDAAARPFAGLQGVCITVADHPDEEAMLRALGNSGLAV